MSHSEKGTKIMSQQNLDLDEIRAKLDSLNEQFLDFLSARLKLVDQVAEFKKANGKEIRDKERESALLRKIALGAKSRNIPVVYAMLVFRAIIEGSVSIEEVRLGIKTETSTGEHYCIHCDWITAGIIDPEINWPVCPRCKEPLLIGGKH